MDPSGKGEERREETAGAELPARFPGSCFNLRVLLFALLAAPRLRRLPPAELASRLEPPEGSDPKRSLPVDAAAALGRRIDRLLRSAQPLVRPGCLTRGITRYWFLRRAGADVALCFGLTRRPGGVGDDGHCWLTLAGEPLAERRDPRRYYLETFRLPGGAAMP